MEEFLNGKSEDHTPNIEYKELLIDAEEEAVKEVEDKENSSSSSSSISSSDDEDEAAPGPGEELIPSTDPGPGPVLDVVDDPSSSSSSSSSDEDEAPPGPEEEPIPGPVLVDDNNNNNNNVTDDSGAVTVPEQEPDYPGTESEVLAEEVEKVVENGVSEDEGESSGTGVKVFPVEEEEETLIVDSSENADLASKETEDSFVPPPPLENIPSVEAEASGSSVVVEEEEEIPESIGNPVLVLTREVRNPTSWRSCCGLFDVLRRRDNRSSS